MSIDDKIKASMKIQGDKWVKAGRPAPGTIAHAQFCSELRSCKPHYVLRGGGWWAFRSMQHCRKYIDAIRKGTIPQLCTPQALTEHPCGYIYNR